MSDIPPIVLTFAATDPSGGAGLQADILTIASMGCHPLSIVTAITVQDTSGVDDVQPVDVREFGGDAAEIVPDAAQDRFDLFRRFFREGGGELVAREARLLEARTEGARYGGRHAGHAPAVDQTQHLDRSDEGVPQYRVAG